MKKYFIALVAFFLLNVPLVFATTTVSYNPPDAFFTGGMVEFYTNSFSNVQLYVWDSTDHSSSGLLQVVNQASACNAPGDIQRSLAGTVGGETGCAAGTGIADGTYDFIFASGNGYPCLGGDHATCAARGDVLDLETITIPYSFGPAPVYGCTDSSAYNYDPLANSDDGSCLYRSDNYNAIYQILTNLNVRILLNLTVVLALVGIVYRFMRFPQN